MLRTPSTSLLRWFLFSAASSPEIYSLSLHDALPISCSRQYWLGTDDLGRDRFARLIYGTRVSLALAPAAALLDRKSTRLNSSHANISYAVFCLKKKPKCHVRWQTT